MSNVEATSNDHLESNYAMKIAFQTMKERCQQLQNRLTVVEKENVVLRLQNSSKVSSSSTDRSPEQLTVKELQDKVEELMRQKSQLTQHVIMVASENRQLWNSLTRMTQANKSLGKNLTAIRDTLKSHSATGPDILSFSLKDTPNSNIQSFQNSQSTTDIGQKEQSLEEISLKLRNSLILEKSELEQQYAEMVELQSSPTLNLNSIGFTYPEDESNSPEHLKQYETLLIQSKEALLVQYEKLKKIVKYIETMKKGVNCKNCLKNSSKKMCQTGTQVMINEIMKENNVTQTSLPTSEPNEKSCTTQQEIIPAAMCPLCSAYFGNEPFVKYHAHVLSHFKPD